MTRRIWHVVSSLLVGGAEMVALRLAQAQRDAGHEVAILALAEGPLGEVCREMGLRFAVLPGMTGARRAVGAIAHFLRVRADIVNTHNPSAHKIGLFARVPARPLIALTVHSEVAAQSARFLQRTLTDGVIACSARIGDVFRQHHADFEASRLALIDNGVALADVPMPGPRSGPPVVLCVARFEPRKDLSTLIRAVVALPDAELVLVGDGAERPDLERLVGELGAGRRVRFLGFRRDVAALLATADVFALSSLTEGMPISVLEAMAAGLPVVGTAVGGMPDVVVDGVTGLLVPPRDPPALSRALADLLGSPERRAALGRAGRERVREQFSLAAMARRYLEAYDRFAAERPRWIRALAR